MHSPFAAPLPRHAPSLVNGMQRRFGECAAPSHACGAWSLRRPTYPAFSDLSSTNQARFPYGNPRSADGGLRRAAAGCRHRHQFSCCSAYCGVGCCVCVHGYLGGYSWLGIAVGRVTCWPGGILCTALLWQMGGWVAEATTARCAVLY